MNEKNTIRVRVKTNKFLDMIVAIETDKTVRQLAHRVLHCFHELAEDHIAVPPKRRDLTVSALKVGNYHISKSEIVGNMINDYDEIQCVLSKAKPKFPNCPKAYQIPPKQSNHSVLGDRGRFEAPQPNLNQQSHHFLNSQDLRKKDKKKAKRQKKRQKMMQQQKQVSKFHVSKDPLPKSHERAQEQVQLDDDAYIIYKPKIFSPCQKPRELVQSELQNSQFNCVQVETNKLINLNPPHQEIVEIKPVPQQIQLSPKINTSNSNGLQNFPLDSIFSISGQDAKQDQNLSTEAKKDQHIRPNPTIKPQQPKKKKPNAGSILQILCKATQEKEKKLKRKDKKNDKAEQNVSQTKLGSSNQPNTNQSQKAYKNQKESSSGNKIASPKVTFHNSPMLSPQVINLNSPKRKISNPNIEKIELETPFELNGIRAGKRQGQKEKKIIQRQQEETKKEALATAPSKIIVEQDSQQSGHASTKLREEQKQPEHVNSKLAALDARISKYKLQFFHESDEE